MNSTDFQIRKLRNPQLANMKYMSDCNGLNEFEVHLHFHNYILYEAFKIVHLEIIL